MKNEIFIFNLNLFFNELINILKRIHEKKKDNDYSLYNKFII